MSTVTNSKIPDNEYKCIKGSCGWVGSIPYTDNPKCPRCNSPAVPHVTSLINKGELKMSDGKESIILTKHEIQSGHSRQQHAENLIRQLPTDHDGRNTWLLNYGVSEEAQYLRRFHEPHPIEWNKETNAAHTTNGKRGECHERS